MSSSPKKRIAVLMCGRIRSFESCYSSHFKHIFDMYETDVFLAHNSLNHEDNIDLFKKTYPVIGYQSYTIDLVPYAKRIKNNTNYGVNGYYCIYMFECLYYAYNLMEQKAHAENIRYDAVIYMRADEIIKSDLIIPDILESNTIYIPEHNDACNTGINDQFAFGSMESMKIYSSLIQHIFNYYDSGALFHPESLMKYHIQQSKLNIIRFSFDYHLNQTRRYAYDIVPKWDIC